jgi:hypothetical protein
MQDALKRKNYCSFAPHMFSPAMIKIGIRYFFVQNQGFPDNRLNSLYV